MYDLAGLQQQAGTYYNSVTDRMEQLPAGAPSYGNGAVPKQDSIWRSIGGVAEDVGEAVESGIDATVGGVKSVFNSVGETVSDVWDWGTTTWLKWLLIIVGLFLAVVWVTGKSGVIGQAAPILAVV